MSSLGEERGHNNVYDPLPHPPRGPPDGPRRCSFAGPAVCGGAFVEVHLPLSCEGQETEEPSFNALASIRCSIRSMISAATSRTSSGTPSASPV